MCWHDGRIDKFPTGKQRKSILRTFLDAIRVCCRKKPHVWMWYVNVEFFLAVIHFTAAPICQRVWENSWKSHAFFLALSLTLQGLPLLVSHTFVCKDMADRGYVAGISCPVQFVTYRSRYKNHRNSFIVRQ